MADYTVRKFKLDTAFEQEPLVSPGTQVPDISVQAMSAAADGHLFLQIGEGGDPISLRLVGQAFHITPPEDTGLFLTNDAALPGSSVEFVVGYVSGVVQV